MTQHDLIRSNTEISFILVKFINIFLKFVFCRNFRERTIMAANVSSRQQRRPIQNKLVNDSALYKDDSEQYSSATESVIDASESNSGQSNILPHNSLQNDCIAEVVDSDMNHSDTEPDSDRLTAMKKLILIVKKQLKRVMKWRTMTHFFTVRNTILIYVSFVKVGL